MKTGKTSTRVFCICLILLLISCLLASALQTSFGKVVITKFSIPTDNGQYVTGLLFRPKEASSEHQVPVVITSHGYLNNNQMQDSTAIELSRRGIAVFAMDAYYHGDSSSSQYSYNDSSTQEGMGMIPLVEYVYSCLDWVDTSRIGITGHSMGGGITWNVARYYGRQVLAALEAAKDPASDGGAEITPEEQAAADALNKVAAAFPVSQIRASTEQAMSEIVCNFGANFGFYDEGAYRCANGDGDLHDAPEALILVNSVLPEGEKLTDEIEIGKLYGDASNGTLRVVYNPHEIHPWQHFSKASAGHIVEFFTTAFGIENPIPTSNQTWKLKEYANLLGLIALFVIIVPMADLLMRVPCFASLRAEKEPALLPAPKGKKGKAIFWGSWVFSWVVSWLSFMTVGKLDERWMPVVAARGNATWFPQTTTNFIMIWAVFNGLVGLLLFVLTYVLYGKKNGITPDMWGIKTTAKELIKTLLLAICVFTGVYLIVGAADYFFTTDFRIWTLDFRHFTADKLKVALMYWPLFFIFYGANSIMVNSSSRVGGMSEKWNIFLCALGNSLGCIIINLIQYTSVFSTGIPHWQADWLRPLVLLPMITQLFVAAYISRALFKKTGKVWLGAFVNTLIIVMMGVANTATFLPFI